MLPTWSEAAILEEVLLTTRKAYVPLPDLRCIERPGWFQIITPSFKDGAFNEVAFSVLEDAEADAVIDATIDEYRRQGIAFRWNVVPGSKPDDLAVRLAARGLTSSLVRGMARSTSDLPDTGERDAVRVHEVDAQTLDVFTRVMAEGWSMDSGQLDVAHQVIFRAADSVRRQRLYLASYQGEPAAVASHVAFPRSAYLLGAVVLPKFRRKGLYRALVNARMRDAAARGIALATSQAMDGTSAPLLEDMGFESVCRYPVFHG